MQSRCVTAPIQNASNHTRLRCQCAPIAARHGPRPDVAGRPRKSRAIVSELDPEVLREMRKEQAKVDGPARVPAGAADIVTKSIHKNHNARRESQHELRQTMALWAGWRTHASRSTARGSATRVFLSLKSRDVLSAQVLGSAEAEELRARIAADLETNRIRMRRVTRKTINRRRICRWQPVGGFLTGSRIARRRPAHGLHGRK